MHGRPDDGGARFRVMELTDRIARGPRLWAEVLELAHDKGLFGGIEIDDEW